MIEVTPEQALGASDDGNAFDLCATFHSQPSQSTYNFWQTCAELMGYFRVYSAITVKCSEGRLIDG